MMPRLVVLRPMVLSVCEERLKLKIRLELEDARTRPEALEADMRRDTSSVGLR